MHQPTEINPCPLCGGRSVIDACEGGTDGLFFVSCLDDRCGCRGKHKQSAALAVGSWNVGLYHSRHRSAAPVAR